MNRYFTEKVASIEALDGRKVRVTFRDGFKGEVDISALLDRGPIFEPLRDDAIFKQVRVERGAPLWPGDLDLSPGALRAWCEAGRFLDYEETDAWIGQHVLPPERVA